MNINFLNLLSQAKQILKPGGSGDSQGINSSQSLGGSTTSGLPSIYQVGGGTKDGRLSLAALFGNESMRLNSQEVSQFLKDTLKLPQEIRFLLLMLALESSPKDVKPKLDQTLKQLIEENLNHLEIPVDDVQALLGKNAQDATDKLMKLLQANQMSQTRSGQQIAELAVSLGKLGEKIKSSPQDALESLMLLYIPWYPLTHQQDLQLSFEMGEGGGEEGEKDISVVIYIETNTLGRFKIAVHELDPLQIVAKVYHEEFVKDIMPRLEENLNKTLAEDGLPACVFSTEVISSEQIAQASKESGAKPEQPRKLEKEPERNAATAGFKKATRQADHKQVIIQPGEHISMLVLNCAYALARFIFEADEENRFLQKNS